MKIIFAFGIPTSRICPFNPEAVLKERLIPSDGVTITTNQNQPATQALANEACDHMHMPLHTSKILETCKKKHALVD